MTVTKGKKNILFPVSSGQASDVESNLESNVGSDIESLSNEPSSRSHPFIPPTYRSIKTEELINLKKNSGRKKLRRFQNRCVLQTLVEEDDAESNVVLMEPYDSPFARLLQDKNTLLIWHNLMEKSEEEQARFVAAFTEKNPSTNQIPQKKPFFKISHKIKRTIKIKKNLSLEQVEQFEDDIVAFFKKTPHEIYAKIVETYFSRLLLHGIAQYHGLISLGLIEDGARKVHVFNTTKNWEPTERRLSDFIAQLRQ